MTQSLSGTSDVFKSNPKILIIILCFLYCKRMPVLSSFNIQCYVLSQEARRRNFPGAGGIGHQPTTGRKSSPPPPSPPPPPAVRTRLCQQFCDKHRRKAIPAFCEIKDSFSYFRLKIGKTEENLQTLTLVCGCLSQAKLC